MAFLFAFSVNAQDCYLAGTMNGWSTNSTKLTKNGGQYELVLKLDEEVEFKVVYNGNWYGFDKIKNGGDLVSNNGGNIKTKTKNCYGIYFKPDNNGEIYLTHAENCPEPFSFWGFDILYQEGSTKKWASTKSTANRWDGNFISTSTDNEVFDLGIVKRGTKFIGFRVYTNDNSSDVQGMNVSWSDVDGNAAAIEGGNYGKWSNDGTKAGASGGTDEVWDVTDRSSKFMGYENGEYSFNLSFEIKVNGQDKYLVRTIKIKYTINEFELTADLNGPCYVGDQVKLTVEGGTSPYTWQTSSDGVSWNTLSGVTGTTYTHKVADKIYFRVKDAASNTTGMVELTPSIKCDPNHTITVFKETFGTLSSVDARTSYSKSNVPVEGHPEITYSARIPSYTVSTVECGAMTDAGRYAVLANPRNAGCGTDIAQDTKNCNCYNSSERWYRDTEDHTSGDTNGGMLMYNCADGTKATPDVLYECTIKGICARTYINFSAFVTCANTGRSGNIPIEAEFKLYSGTTATGTPLSIIPVKNIGLNTTWKEISAMFNSGTATTVTMQLVNKAADGQGNDLLLDDITLSICTPEASLVCSDGVSTEKTIFAGESEELTSYIMSGIMEDPYYLWLTSEDNNADIKEWDVVDNPAKTVLSVSPTKTTYYKVIISNTKEEAEAVYKKETSTACGMHAITNTVTVNVDVKDLVLTSAITDGDICVDGVDENTLTLTLKNPRLVEAKDVKVKLDNIANLNITKVSGTGTYSSGVWTVGNLAADATASIVLKITSNTSVAAVMSRVIGSFVSEVDVETYASYENAPASSKKQTTLKLNPVPAAPTLINNGVYNECAKSGNIALSTLASGTNLKFYSDATLTTVETSFSASTVVTDKKYYVTQKNEYNCTSPAATISVTVKELPTLNSITTDKTAICKDESSATLTYNISGGLAPYTLYINRTVAGTSETVTPVVDATGTYLLNPSSDATYKFTKVEDANGCESTSNKTVSIDVQEINVIENISDANVCADKTKKFTVNATGENLNYKWYESTNGGTSFTQVGTNSATYTTGSFSMGDQKQYKVEVYQNPKVCGAVEGLAKVTVNDCSGFELIYNNETSNVVCKGETIKLKLILKNNSEETANSVVVKITDIVNQTIVSRNANLGSSYNHNIGEWTIPSLVKGAAATLTLEIEGTNIVKDLVSKAYVKMSGSTTYTEATTKAFASQKITVKDITTAPTLIDETYKGCPEVGMLNLNTQVSSDATNLKFYTTETGSVTDNQANKNTEGTTIYWVSNTEDGKCESPRTKLDITVYPQPTAALSGDATICKGSSSNLLVTLTGKPSYTVKLSDGTEERLNVTGNITVNPTATTIYNLSEVKDGNGCYATLSGSATITVNDIPEITLSRVDLDDFCPGESLQLPTNVEVEDNGADITSQGWLLNDTPTTSPIVLESSHNNAVIKYTATNACGTSEAAEYATLVVKQISDDVEISDNYIMCPTELSSTRFLSEFVTSNNDGLKYFDKNADGTYTQLTTEPSFDTSKEFASHTYYITNTKTGECESTNPTPITVEIFKPVTASISGVSPLCSGEISNVNITLDGTPKFEVVYNNGTTDVPKTISGTTLNITESLTSTTTYKLVSVTDKNTCQAYLDGTELVTITVNPRPELVSFEIEDADDIICEGESTTLKATFTGTAPFSFKINGEDKTSDATEWSMTISDEKEYVITDLSDVNCSAETISNNSATLTVEEIPVVTLSTTSAELDCNNQETTITASGAYSYSWTDNKGTAAQSGASIVAKQTGSETIYTVVGSSEHGCVSEAKTVTVTENFVAPTVEMTTYNYGIEVDLEKDLILTCNHYAVTLKADTENSPVDIASYKWSTGAEGETYSLLIADAAGVYTVEVTGVNGCKATGNIEVKENFTLPDITLKAYRHNKDVESTILTCSYPTLDLKATINNPEEIGVEDVYLYWEIDGRDMSGPNPLAVYAPGEYKVYIQGDNYCKNYATINITEDTEHPELKLTASSDKITCDITEVELTVESNIEEVDYDWISWNREDGLGDGISNTSVAKVEKGGNYEVIVTVSATGCANSKRITLEEYTDLPVVEITSSEEKVTCKPNTLTASGAKTYTWSTEEAKDAIEVTIGGTYTVYGKNEYGCVGEAEITLEEDKLAPSIKLTSDTTTVTCRKQTVVLTAEVTNAEDARTYSYTWAQNNVVSNVTKSTFDAKVEATYKVTITDETNACKADETINIKENKQNPLVDIKPLAAVCLPATVDLKTAVGPLTKADEVKYYADAALTQEVTDTNIDAAENAIYYVVGYEIDNNGCVGDAYSIPVNIKPTTSKPVVENYNECAEVGTKTLSSLVKSDKTKLVFFEDETSEAPIADLFSTSAENTTTTYWVSNTKTGACESERVAIEVKIAGYIDFSVEASQTRLPAGQEVTITVTPLSDTPVDEYVWYRGDEVVQATDELELTEQLYLNEKYSVQAVGRCNSPKKEVDVEAIWPTAFTPHNGNGKNDSFADGMEIIVFNRFYTKIYEGPSGWDGTINGAMNDGKQTAVPGVYYYSVLLPNGQVKKGTIEIVKVD